MIRITDPKRCCGCSACMAICPHDAISMIPDELGFRYPQVDPGKCVDCGLCEAVCTFAPCEVKQVPAAFAVRHKNDLEVKASTSGAVFAALSDYVLDCGGTVYGAGFGEHFRVMHKRAVNKAERDEFRKSKYVQSDMGDTFRLVKEDLKAGMPVLFTGTPCQTAGLRSYVGEKYAENLYLADIVCHGTPSPEVWDSYLSWHESRIAEKAKNVIFRDKAFGWRISRETIEFEDRRVSSRSYNYLFYRNIMMRESCGVCPFASVYRPSDLTIADYWRKDKACPDFASDNLGCSLVLCSTDKGRKFMADVAENLHIQKVELEECLQLNLVRPTALHPDRKKFASDFTTHGIGYVMKRYGDMGWRYKFMSSIRSVYQYFRQTTRKIIGRR